MEEVDIQGHNGANQTQTESTADEINPTLVGDIHVEARSRRDRARGRRDNMLESSKQRLPNPSPRLNNSGVQVHVSYVTRKTDGVINRAYLFRVIREMYGMRMNEFLIKKQEHDPRKNIQSGYGFAFFDNYEDAMALVRNFKGLTLNGVSYDCSISDRSKKFLGLSDQGVGGRGDGQSEEMSAASNNMVHQSNNMPMPTSSSSLSPRSSVTSHHHTFFQQPQQHQQSLTDGIPHVGDNHPGSVQSYQQSHFDDHLSPAAVSDPRTLYSPGPSMYQVSPPSHYIPMQSNYPGYPPNLSVPGMIPMPPAIPLRGVAQQHSSYSNVFSNASRGTHPASQYHSVQSSFNYPSANFTNPPRRYRFPSTPNDGRR